MLCELILLVLCNVVVFNRWSKIEEIVHKLKPSSGDDVSATSYLYCCKTQSVFDFLPCLDFNGI